MNETYLDPKTDTALCARCKRTMRLVMMATDRATGQHACTGQMLPSCKRIAGERAEPQAEVAQA